MIRNTCASDGRRGLLAAVGRRALATALPFLAVGSASAETHGLFVAGLGGDPVYEESFFDTTRLIYESAIASGIDEERLIWLAEDTDDDPRIRARSTSEEVLAAIDELSGAMSADDVLWVVIVGHGSYRDGQSKVNLPGRDLTAEDWTAALAGLPADSHVVFVNTTSASGGFLEALSDQGRVVVTATKSAAQRNGTVFPTYFAAAFAERTADSDQDGFVSALEAFSYASSEVGRHYEDRNLLRTENALLDDNGDGAGSLEPDALGGSEGGGDGLLASRLVLGASALSAIARTPENAELLDRKAELQRRLDDLRRQKASLEESVYLDELQNLLVEMARVDRRLRGEAGADAVDGDSGGGS